MHKSAIIDTLRPSLISRCPQVLSLNKMGKKSSGAASWVLNTVSHIQVCIPKPSELPYIELRRLSKVLCCVNADATADFGTWHRYWRWSAISAPIFRQEEVGLPYPLKLAHQTHTTYCVSAVSHGNVCDLIGTTNLGCRSSTKAALASADIFSMLEKAFSALQHNIRSTSST